MELALALARIVGDEQPFIQLLRQVRADTGTASSQALIALKKSLSERSGVSPDLVTTLDKCAEDLARGNLESGVALLGEMIRLLPLDELGESCRTILQDSSERLDEFGTRRIEYIVLALHALNAGVT
jgi:hypothetical protein